MSLDDSYYIIPFNPSANSDYVPNPANNYVGLMNIETDNGAAYWVMTYTPTAQFVCVPVDGAISPDNLRYYYLIKEATSTFYGGILSVRIADGSIVIFVRYGDMNVVPFGIASSKADRLAVNSRVDPGSGGSWSVYFQDHTITSKN